MTDRLFDERVVAVQPSLVRIVGSVTRAAVVQQIHYHAQAGHVQEYEGEQWVVRSHDALGREIGLTGPQVRRAVVKLCELGVLQTCRPGGHERTTWHRIVDGSVGGMPNVQNRTMQASVTNNALFGSEQCTPSRELKSPPGGAPRDGDAPDAVQRIIAGYVDDVRAVEDGHDPPQNWKGAAGTAIKRALRDGETERDIQNCLGIIATEGKNPATLAHVLSDMHANRPRRRR